MTWAYSHVVRRWRQRPLLPLAAAVSLGMTLAVNSTVFAIVNALFLRPLPVTSPETLFDIVGEARGFRPSQVIAPYDDYEQIVRQRDSTVIEGVAGSAPLLRAVVAAESGSQVVMGEIVSPDYFRLLGIRPILGRLGGAALEAEDAVISERLWRTVCGEDPQVIGRHLRVNGLPFVVRAIAPRHFRGLVFSSIYAADVWIPAANAAVLLRGAPLWVQMKARCVPGTTLAVASATVAHAAHELVDARILGPGTKIFAQPGGVARLSPGIELWARTLAFWVLVGSGLMLGIACVNVAIALVSSGVDREPEIALRHTLGAPRWRLLVELLTEPIMLACAGGIVGLACSYLSVMVLAGERPELTPGVVVSVDPRIDWRVAVFTAAAVCLTALLCGIWPTRHLARTDVRTTLSGGPFVTRRRDRWRADDIIVVAHVGATVVLVVVAVQLCTKLLERRSADLGFRQTSLAFTHVESRDPRGISQQELDRLLDRLRSKAAVEAVTTSESIPFGGEVEVRCGVVNVEETSSNGCDTVVGPGYFDVLGIPLMVGRDFYREEHTKGNTSVVISTTAASLWWPGRNPLGRTFLYKNRPMTVVGVVRDVDHGVPKNQRMPFLYLAQGGGPDRDVYVLARGRGQGRTTAMALREALRECGEDLTATPVMPFADYMQNGPLYPLRFASAIAATVAGTALSISVFGLYAVVARTTGRRRREFAVRRAMGADAWHLLKAGLGREVIVITAGVAGGLSGAWATTAALSKSVFSDLRLGWPTACLVTVIVLSTAGAACVQAVRRSWRADPAVVLRET